MSEFTSAGQGVPAKYRDLEKEESGSGNPLVEALRPPRENDEPLELFYRLCRIPENIGELSRERRLMLIPKLMDVLIPEFSDYFLYFIIVGMVIDGYVPRNPFGKKEGELNSQNYSAENSRLRSPAIRTFLIEGYSGTGKTTAVLTVLRDFPQLIEHTEYRGKEFEAKQVVYVKVDCPATGSVPAFLRQVCIALKEAVGDYKGADKLMTGRFPQGSLMPLLRRLTRKYHLGVLVVDEVQNLANVGKKNQAALLNIFTEIANALEVPIIFIGTPPVHELLTNQMHVTRRIGTIARITWERLRQDEAPWETFIDLLWPLQFTFPPTELTEELKAAMYEETQGIIAIVIMLFMRVQYHAITDPNNPDEAITPEAIHEVMEKEFSELRAFTRSIENGDEKTADLTGQIVASNWEDFKTLESLLNPEADKGYSEAVAKIALNDYARRLPECSGLKEEEVAEIVEEVLASGDLGKVEREGLAREIARIRTGKDAAGDVGSLSELVQNTPESQDLGYEALKEAGVIKNPSEI